MKKGTLIVLVLAVALGGYVYYSEFRHPKEPKPAEDAPQAFWSFTADDIVSIRVTHVGEGAAPAYALERRAADWVLTEPVQARADRSAVDGLAGELARAKAKRQIPAEAARLKDYGLDPPAATVDIALKNGQKQRLELGVKDFSGLDVYARQGGAGNVLLLADTVLSEVSRPLLDFRDRSVLLLPSWTLSEMDVRTAKTKFRLEKKGDEWTMTEPRSAPADDDTVGDLVMGLSSARLVDVSDENAADRAKSAKFGLTDPAITIHVRGDNGSEGTLLIGKKDGERYFARDASRPAVFRIEGSLVKKFEDSSFDSLRDKHIVHLRADDFTAFTVRNEKGTITAKPTGSNKWTVEEPADRKGKEIGAWRVFDPLNAARATQVIDQPSPAVLAKFAKPAVEVKLTDKKGATLTVTLSAADGNTVYGRSSLAPTVYKLDVYTLNQLNFAPGDASP